MIVLSYLQNMIFFYYLNSISDLPSQFLLLNFMLFVVCSVARIDLKGIAAVFDADLLKWVEYQPSTVPRKRHRATEKRISRVLSRSFSASTPRKQKSYARSKYVVGHKF